MDPSCPSCPTCHSAALIFSSGSFVHISLGIRLLTGLLALLGLVIMALALSRTKALHFNARVLLLLMIIASLISTFGITTGALYKLYVGFFLDQKLRCEYQVYRPTVIFVVRSLYVIGGQGIVGATILLAIERTVATVSYRTYETKQKHWLGVSLSLLNVVFMAIQGINLPLPHYLPYYSPELDDSVKTKWTASGLYFIYALALLVFIGLWITNRRRKEARLTSQLSVRYQLRENISTTLLMIPVVVVAAMLTTLWQIGCLVFLPDIDRNTAITDSVLQEIVIFARYDEFQIAVTPLLTICLLVMLPAFSDHIRKSLRRITGLNRSSQRNQVDALNPKEESHIYFVSLQEQWMKKSRPRVNKG